MSTNKTVISGMLEAAARLRRFARATAIPRYQANFHRVADDLEREAIGWAASDAVVQALHEAGTRSRVERFSC